MMEESVYPGSQLLLPIAQAFDFPIDQTNFLASQALALVLGYIFRVHFGPHSTSPLARHVFEVVFGVSLMLFLFGYQAIFVFGQTVSCYILMRILPDRSMPKVVTIVAMTQLSVCHLWRQLYHYRSSVAFEISIPYMINTQRVTSLAWGLFDGKVKDKDTLTPNQRRLAVKKMPTVLEVLSYCLNFHSCLLGPSCMYKDYIKFIHGTNLETKHVANGTNNNNHHVKINHDQPQCPSPLGRVVWRLMLFALYSLITVIVCPAFPTSYITDPAFLNANFFGMMRYLVIITCNFRYKYFAAWKISEAVGNNAGFGFYHDEKGQQRWDLADTVNPIKVEFATSLKMLLDNWNITCNFWLRYIVFERVTYMRSVMTFFVSSLWHGFYPGYYLTAANAAMFGGAARLVRVNFRWWFAKTEMRLFAYDIITFVTLRVVIAYMCFPFMHLEFYKPLEVYKKMYFSLHIVGFLVIAALSLRRPPRREILTKKIS